MSVSLLLFLQFFLPFYFAKVHDVSIRDSEVADDRASTSLSLSIKRNEKIYNQTDLDPLSYISLAAILILSIFIISYWTRLLPWNPPHPPTASTYLSQSNHSLPRVRANYMPQIPTAAAYIAQAVEDDGLDN